MPQTSPILTIIIVARNESGNLPRLLESIHNLDDSGDAIATLLVDHNSTDNTAEVATSCGCEHIVRLTGGTIAEARNAGGQAVSTPWMAFIDADCELEPDWWKRLNPNLDTSAIYGWPVEPPSPPSWVQAAWHTHWMQKLGALNLKKPPAFIEQGAFRLITTANMIIPKSMFDQLKGFDSHLSSGEDQNLMLRAMQAGLTIRALPGLRVIHHGEPRTLRDFYHQQLWHANRASYSRILSETGMKKGGNAPLFTILYFVTLLTLPIALILALWVHPIFLLGSFCWPGLIAGPALRTALRAHKPKQVFALSILYAAYGLARSLDLLGLNPTKRSWRV